jgi:hypothetical protein
VSLEKEEKRKQDGELNELAIKVPFNSNSKKSWARDVAQC